MNRTLSALIGAAFITTSSFAIAHGDDDHKKSAKAKTAAVEEKSFGRAGDPKKVSRTISVSMNDQMRYEPAEIRVRTGETVKLVVANKGKTLHEIVLGTMDELKQHADLMKKNPGMEHDEPHMAHVKAGGKEDLVWQFTKPGEFYYACLIPGHFEAGMVGKVIVASK